MYLWDDQMVLVWAARLAYQMDDALVDQMATTRESVEMKMNKNKNKKTKNMTMGMMTNENCDRD